MMRRSGQTWDGLTRNSTWRERRHYRRHGTWPASYLQRMFEQYGAGISREEAESIATDGRSMAPMIRKALRGQDDG